jgi:nicotinamide-nucleotide amidase
MQFAMNQQLASLSEILGNAIISFDDIAIEKIIGQLLEENGKTVATAESCTGGKIAASIVSIEGSSNYYKGSVVAYSNEIKIRVLNVASELIDEFGVVSAEVVEAMAVGARRLMQSDFAIATSGIAGPSGGTAEKPVGTVWIAVASDRQLVSRLFCFGTDRNQNIDRTTQAAFLLLKEFL